MNSLKIAINIVKYHYLIERLSEYGKIDCMLDIGQLVTIHSL